MRIPKWINGGELSRFLFPAIKNKRKALADKKAGRTAFSTEEKSRYLKYLRMIKKEIGEIEKMLL